MSDVPVPEFWSNYDKRRHLLNDIGSAGRRMEATYKRQKVNVVDEDRASGRAKTVADARFRKEAEDWVRAALLAERECIAAEIEATYPDIGKVIADGIRGRPVPLKQEPEAA